MPEPRNYQTDAIVIKKIKLGEADRILTLYSPEFGKIEAVAKGVRNPKSKMAGHLELLTYSLIRLARGRNLDTIIGSQTIDSFAPIKADFLLTSQALYATDLMNQFTLERIGNHRLFQLFLNVLRQLTKALNSELTLRYFELHLLELAGYRPQLQICVSCHSELKPITNAFCSVAGGMLCPDCRDKHPTAFVMTVDALKVLRLLQRTELDVVNRLKIGPDLAQEMKTALGDFIHHVLEREVKSANWVDSLEQTLGD